jgi:zinc transport system substrate-binding protein
MLLALTLTSALALAFPAAPPPTAPLKIGVTLHPYYSWTANVVAGAPDVEVRAIISGEIDAGNYQPKPEDIKRIADLDAIVINGVGHDDFIRDMIKASGNAKIVLIETNQDTPKLTSARGGEVNSHTFISFTNAVQQTYAIQKALAALRPELAPLFQKNAQEYARRLRAIRSKAATELANAKAKRIVTVHDGYSYLLQEFGLELAGVVEPAHGLVPSAKELSAMVDLLGKEKTKIVLSEESFPAPLLKVLRDSTGARVYVISHIATGAYSAEEFEREMEKNVATLIQAVVRDG